MIKHRKPFLLIMTATLNLSACSYIQSLFPDKEKDYQYTTEIPPLVLPSDLKAGPAVKAVEESSLSGSQPIKNQNESSANSEQINQPLENAESVEKNRMEENSGQLEQQPEKTGQAAQQEKPEQNSEAKEEKKDAKKEGTSVELLRFSNGERRLRISSSLNTAWHLVSKALSRNSIEVTERDQDQKFFNVLYAPEVKKAEDGSLWDEAVFMFTGVETNEKEYLLKLIPIDDKTDLAITDKDLNPVSDDAAVKLLRLLGGTIQGN
jgi:outer membrane protein assembly factor BamC